MLFFYLLKYELIKEYFDIKHYFINYFFNIINQSIICFLFLNMFMKENSNMFEFLLKILVWWLGSDLITKMPYMILEEKREGTLEFIFSNLKHLDLFLFVKTLSMIFFSILNYCVLAFFLISFEFAANNRFVFAANYYDISKVILALVACTGYGYFFSGITLIYRKTSTMVNTFGYLLLLGQFASFKGPFKTVMNVIPSTWITNQLEIYQLIIISVLIFIFGLYSFSLFLKLSLKSGAFWR